ncbi:MAG: hypothetical protein HY287_15595 [Planctomycetes bacterium]|nr:hypothetical protein [Planctomycetota bacterium]MBI3835749.1 hypothetical protein [Planctomycetota bacterium]
MRHLSLALAAVSLGTSASVALAQHNTDVWPGVTGTNLAWSPAGFQPASLYNPLFPVDTFLHGWSNNNPGFNYEQFPAGDVLPMPQGVQVWLEVISLDPALLVADVPSGIVLDSPGQRMLLGGATLHVHLTWFVDKTDPGFNPDLCVFKGTFRFVDTGIGLGPSPPFTFLFATVPVRGGEFPPTNSPASGDFDEDSDVNKKDYKAFRSCMEGPGARSAPNDSSITTCEVDCFNAFDFDDSMSIDLFDFAELQIHFTGG